MGEISRADQITDHMRRSAINLSTLTRPATDEQIDAMTFLVIAGHQYVTEVAKGAITGKDMTTTRCDCGWTTTTQPGDFKRYQWEVTRHIMADVATRVFSNPIVR